MSDQENIKVASAFFDAWNSGDLRKALSYETENYKSEAPGSPVPLSKDENLAYNQNFFDAFPGSKFKILLTVAQGEYVVFHWSITGKNTGALRSPSGAVIPPTGKTGTVNGSTTVQVRDGKAIYSWAYFDMASLLGQLGLLPPM